MDLAAKIKQFIQKEGISVAKEARFCPKHNTHALRQSFMVTRKQSPHNYGPLGLPYHHPPCGSSCKSANVEIPAS